MGGHWLQATVLPRAEPAYEAGGTLGLPADWVSRTDFRSHLTHYQLTDKKSSESLALASRKTKLDGEHIERDV